MQLVFLFPVSFETSLPSDTFLNTKSTCAYILNVETSDNMETYYLDKITEVPIFVFSSTFLLIVVYISF